MNTVKTPRKKNTRSRASIRFSHLPRIEKVIFRKDEVGFLLSDDRSVFVPIKYFPALCNATPAQKKNYTTNGLFVFWDDVDEIVGVKNLLDGSVTR